MYNNCIKTLLAEASIFICNSITEIHLKTAVIFHIEHSKRIKTWIFVNYVSHRTIYRTESHTSLARLVAHRNCSANSIITQMQLCKPQYCTRLTHSYHTEKNWVISATGKILVKFLRLWYLSINCIKVLLTGFSYISGNAIIEMHAYRPESHTHYTA